jgi:AraC family transcriptional regulator
MRVKIAELPPIRVAFLHHIGLPERAAWKFERLFAWAEAKGLSAPGTTAIGVCHDDPELTPSETLHSEACVTVSPQARTEGEIRVRDIPGGIYAVVTHTGPRAELREAYRRLLTRQLPATGWRPDGRRACFEIYRDGPSRAAEDPLTIIHVPVRE